MVRKLTHEEAVQKLIDNDIKFKLLSPYTKRTNIHTFLCYCGKEFESSYDTIITGGILNGYFTPPTRYGFPVVKNATGVAASGAGVNMYVALIPIIDDGAIS